MPPPTSDSGTRVSSPMREFGIRRRPDRGGVSRSRSVDRRRRRLREDRRACSVGGTKAPLAVRRTRALLLGRRTRALVSSWLRVLLLIGGPGLCFGLGGPRAVRPPGPRCERRSHSRSLSTPRRTRIRQSRRSRVGGAPRGPSRLADWFPPRFKPAIDRDGRLAVTALSACGRYSRKATLGPTRPRC